jgi:HAE1 family hydrophobic/amphiphilic exporter-1
MNLAGWSIRRPVFTVMVTLMTLILGGVALLRVPVDLMPDITYPTLTVSTEYGEASPAEIEELLTRPIEEAMSAVPGVEEVSSVSQQGSSRVRITFSWGTDLDAAANDVRDRLDRVIPRLPEDAERPTLRKFDLASFPVMILGASSTLDPVRLRKLIDDQVKYRIERVPGVAALDVWGGQEREIQVLLDPERLLAIGLSIEDVLARIQTANVNLPAGVLEQGNYEIAIRTPGEFTDLDQIRETILAVRDGAPVRLGDVAEIRDAWQKEVRRVRVNGQPGVRLAVNKQSGRNTVEVCRAVRAELERLREALPQVEIAVLIDTSDYIQRSITNVGRSALYGGLYAILVLLLFLRNVRSTAIIATAIPISVIATFLLIHFGGFTLNLMTLGGLALGVGMLVDNSIVVLENIYRLRESGAAGDAASAAERGAEEVTGAILASTLTTVVVFLPLVFVRGMSGVMFTQLAYVVGFSLLCSVAVALTLVPMLASRFLRTSAEAAARSGAGRHRLLRALDRTLETLEERYRRLLDACLAHRGRVVAVAVLLVVVSLALLPLVGTELMPASDESEVRINVELDVGSRLDLVDEAFRPIEDIVAREVPEARSVVVSIGPSGGFMSSAGHAGFIRVALAPVRERRRSSEQIAADLRPKLMNIPGATVRTRAGQGLFILRMGAGETDQLELEIRGYDIATGDALAREVKAVVQATPGVTDARLSRESGKPERLVHVDRAKAELLKVTVARVAGLLQTVLGGTRAGYFREAGDEYPILVKLKDAEKRPLDEVLDLTLPNTDGDLVALRNVVEVRSTTGPVALERHDQERVVKVQAGIQGRDMGSVIADIQERLKAVPLPSDFSVEFTGDYTEQRKAFRELGLGLGLALLLVYMVMACQYESLRDPLVVMLCVPTAIIGVVLMLLLTHTTFNVQSYIGCIMLGGIVVNNAIVLVDQTNLLRRRDGLPAREAIREAGRRRLRPILMTALTTGLGLMPMALGVGEGGSAQAPLARAVVGGLTSATLLTLVVIPVVYSLFEEGWKPHAKPIA